MPSRNSELMKNTIILAIGQIVPKIIALFILPILTTFLTKKDFGLYELTISVASFCIPLLSVQIQQGLFRYLLDSIQEKKEIISTSLFFILVMFLFASIPIVAGWSIYTKDIWLGILFWISYFAEVMLTWSGQVTRGLGNNVLYSLAYVIYSIIFILMLLVFLFLNTSLSVKHVAVAVILAYVSAFSFLFLKMKIFNYISLRYYCTDSLKNLLSYSAPMVISSVALWTVNLSDRFFISAFLGIESTAIYSVANKIPNLFNSIYNIFNLAWTENTSKLSAKEKQEGYYTIFFNDFYQLMVGMMLVLITLSPILFRILINEKYFDAYKFMAWIFIGVFFSSLVSFFGSIYVGEKKTKVVGFSSAIGAVINVAINLFFMKQLGISVAIVSTIVSYCAICVYRAFDVKKYVLISYNPFRVCLGLICLCGVATMNQTFSLNIFLFSVFITISYNFIFNRKIFMKIYFMLMKNFHLK